MFIEQTFPGLSKLGSEDKKVNEAEYGPRRALGHLWETDCSTMVPHRLCSGAVLGVFWSSGRDGRRWVGPDGDGRGDVRAGHAELKKPELLFEGVCEGRGGSTPQLEGMA